MGPWGAVLPTSPQGHLHRSPEPALKHGQRKKALPISSGSWRKEARAASTSHMQIEALGAKPAKEACGWSKKPAGRDWGWGGGRSLKVKSLTCLIQYIHIYWFILYILYVWADSSLIAQLVENPPAMKETPASWGDPDSWVGKICWRRDRLPTPVFLGFPCGSAGKKKNPPVMRETWVWSLGWEDPPEKGKATHSSNSGLENSMGCKELDTTEWLSLYMCYCTDIFGKWLSGVAYGKRNLKGPDSK